MWPAEAAEFDGPAVDGFSDFYSVARIAGLFFLKQYAGGPKISSRYFLLDVNNVPGHFTVPQTFEICRDGARLAFGQCRMGSRALVHSSPLYASKRFGGCEPSGQIAGAEFTPCKPQRGALDGCALGNGYFVFGPRG